MKKSFLKLIVMSALVFPLKAMSLGFEALPTSGFSVPSGGAGSHQPTGGVSPYRLCNTTGNYGSLVTGPIYPTVDANNACALVPPPSSILSSPEPGFLLIRTANRPITMNNLRTHMHIGSGLALQHF